MELSREALENLDKDLVDLQKLLALADRDYTKSLLHREITVLQSKKDLV